MNFALALIIVIITFMASVAGLIYAVLLLDDVAELKSDRLRASDYCNRASKHLIPDLTIHWGTVVFLLVTRSWLGILAMTPLSVLHLYRLKKGIARPDETKVLARLGSEMLVGVMRTVTAGLMCVYALYRFVRTVVKRTL